MTDLMQWEVSGWSWLQSNQSASINRKSDAVREQQQTGLMLDTIVVSLLAGIEMDMDAHSDMAFACVVTSIIVEDLRICWLAAKCIQ